MRTRKQDWVLRYCLRDAKLPAEWLHRRALVATAAATALVGACGPAVDAGSASDGQTRRQATSQTTSTASVDDTSTASVFARVQKILVDHLGVAPDKISMSSNIIKDLGADSLDTVELVMAFEEEFNLEITDDEAEKLVTVGDCVRTIQLKLRRGEHAS